MSADHSNFRVSPVSLMKRASPREKEIIDYYESLLEERSREEADFNNRQQQKHHSIQDGQPASIQADGEEPDDEELEREVYEARERVKRVDSELKRLRKELERRDMREEEMNEEMEQLRHELDLHLSSPSSRRGSALSVSAAPINASAVTNAYYLDDNSSPDGKSQQQQILLCQELGEIPEANMGADELSGMYQEYRADVEKYMKSAQEILDEYYADKKKYKHRNQILQEENRELNLASQQLQDRVSQLLNRLRLLKDLDGLALLLDDFDDGSDFLHSSTSDRSLMADHSTQTVIYRSSGAPSSIKKTPRKKKLVIASSMPQIIVKPENQSFGALLSNIFLVILLVIACLLPLLYNHQLMRPEVDLVDSYDASLYSEFNSFAM